MAKVYAYSNIAGVEEDEEGNKIAVYYEPGTELNDKGFTKEQLAHMLERGTASLYDPTKTPEEAAEAADAENAALRKQVESLKAQLEGVGANAADAQADELAAAQLREENAKLGDEVANLRKELQQKQEAEAARAAKAEEQRQQKAAAEAKKPEGQQPS
jgi:hypothetical protein